MAGAADELVCVATPEPFGAIGRFYADFDQTTDEEVLACLERSGGADTPAPAEPSRTEEPGIDTDLAVRLGPAHLHSHLPGHLTVPPGATGLVLFAHGSGSSRHSPRNQYVAGVLNDAGVGTYLFDLLTPHEADDRENVFDIDLLGSRLAGATRALLTRPELDSLAIGYFGASTGAAAALWAASEPDLDIAAVVSRGGRPDLAERRLARVEAPTLLIVGGDDHVVADLNRRARAELRSCPSDLVVIPGAGHLFEEPGTLAAAAAAARDWFVAHLGAPASRPI
jgi:putative phosphoribosyl transferase